MTRTGEQQRLAVITKYVCKEHNNLRNTYFLKKFI